MVLDSLLNGTNVASQLSDVFSAFTSSVWCYKPKSTAQNPMTISNPKLRLTANIVPRDCVTDLRRIIVFRAFCLKNSQHSDFVERLSPRQIIRLQVSASNFWEFARRACYVA
jgi:hypothetical protein